ncbi:hypothetical protein ACQVPL_16935 [Bacillus hominis]|uniref:hypothetical protein n=1 Tax=Bacillus cereus group TaxID=86661 RepID=UPI00103F77AC|nr:hypothetical protein [Bacillus wiedmannii]TCD31182.1 hypothetical protein E0D84_19460 [Bacillus wiedmannii]
MKISDGNTLLLEIMTKALNKTQIEPIPVKIPGSDCEMSETQKRQVESFFQFVYLIDPLEVSKEPVIHPEFLRYQNNKDVYKEPEYLQKTFKGRTWSRYIMLDGKEYRAAPNNVRAKYAFKEYTNVNLTNDKAQDRLYGYTVAHIFGGADSPLLFSAGFNLALILDGLVKFTDEQHLHPIIYWALTSATYLLNKPVLDTPYQLWERYNISPHSVNLNPLYPIIKDRKIVKQNFRMQFQVVEPFPFWFDVNVINRKGDSYQVVQLRPQI